MNFDKILIGISKIKVANDDISGNSDKILYSFDKMIKGDQIKFSSGVRIIPYEQFILAIDKNEIEEILVELFEKNILLLNTDEGSRVSFEKYEKITLNNYEDIIKKYFREKELIYINIAKFEQNLIKVMVKITEERSKKIEIKTNELGDNIQNFSRDIMVIMSLFIAIIGFVTTNNNVYNIISHYDIKRQILTVLSANLAVAYVITTVFVLIDSIVSFSSDKSKVRTIWIWMTIFMGFIILFLK